MQPYAYAYPKKTSMSTAAGILLIIGGILGIINQSVVIATGGRMYGEPSPTSELLVVCAAITLVFAIIGMIGGFYAMQRKVWNLALAGSVFGLFSLGPLFISSLFGLIALILIAISKEEFES